LKLNVGTVCLAFDIHDDRFWIKFLIGNEKPVKAALALSSKIKNNFQARIDAMNLIYSNLQ
jgi:hypothetical protein